MLELHKYFHRSLHGWWNYHIYVEWRQWRAKKNHQQWVSIQRTVKRTQTNDGKREKERNNNNNKNDNKLDKTEKGRVN